MLEPGQAEGVAGDLDPATRSEIAHETAAILVGAGHERRDDPQVQERLVALVQTEGIEMLASLWSHSPARSLPGALWRLYVLGEWVRRDPAGVARRYESGLASAEVAGVVAGVERPPGPDEVHSMIDRVLRGMFVGDFGDQLDRAAAFLEVLAAGGAVAADEETDDEEARATTRRAGSLLDTARDLSAAARQWRAGALD